MREGRGRIGGVDASQTHPILHICTHPYTHALRGLVHAIEVNTCVYNVLTVLLISFVTLQRECATCYKLLEIFELSQSSC